VWYRASQSRLVVERGRIAKIIGGTAAAPQSGSAST